MFFQQRRKKKQTEEHPAPEKFVYFLKRENDANIDLLTLGHSGSESGDTEDFTSISIELLAALFSPFWVSAWVHDGTPHDYVLPDHQRCGRKECFSQALQQYAKRSGVRQLFAANEKGNIAFFSQGLYLPFFASYMSDISEDFFNREMFFYGYKQSFTPSNDYNTENQRNELLPWDLHAYFDELHDNVLLYIKTPYVTEHVITLVQQICEKYGKELHMSCDRTDTI